MYLDELFQKTFAKRMLYSTQLALTHQCNLSCRHCYLDPVGGKILEPAEFKGIIDQVAEMGCLYLALTGGEPMLYSGFWEIVAHARQNKFLVSLFTNGTLIDERTAARLADSGVHEVFISLYGPNAQVHEQVTGVKGSFAKTLGAIRFLQAQNLQVLVRSTVMTLNQDYSEQTKSLCRDLGVDCTLYYLLFPRTDGNQEPCMLQYPGESLGESQQESQQESVEKSVEESRNPTVANLCAGLENLCFIDHDGTLYPCVNYRFPCGNVTTTSLKELWNSERVQGVREDKNTAPSCRGCGEINTCLKCPGLSYYEAGDKKGYSSKMCEFNRVLKSLNEGGVPVEKGLC